MRLYLPVSLRKSLISCLVASIASTFNCSTVWASSEAAPQNLIFEGDTLTWNTNADNKAFTNAEGENSSFIQGDNVSFTNSANIILGEDIVAGTVVIEVGSDVTLNEGDFSLNVQKIRLLGTLDAGDTLSVGGGKMLSIESSAASLESKLALNNACGLSVAGVANMNNNTVTLGEDIVFNLTATGDGRVYNLFSNVSGLKDAQGNDIVLDSTNNAISNYFDITQPGTGFWADAKLQLTDNGTLQLVRYNGITHYYGYSKVSIDDFADIAEYKGSKNDIHFLVDSNHLEGRILNIKEANVLLSQGTGATWHFTSESASELSSISFSNLQSLLFAVNNTLEFRMFKEVHFDSNQTINGNSDYDGGLISGGSVSIVNNGLVSIKNNSATSSDGFSVWGGVIYGTGISISDNDQVVATGNTISTQSEFDSRGGVICAWTWGTTYITLSDNGAVLFSGNSVSNAANNSKGGSICGYDDCRMVISGNGSVSLENNRANMGGAIYGGIDSILTFSKNGEVRFIENEALGNSSNSIGGAIYGDSVYLEQNNHVLFKGNKVTNTTYVTEGGAIYVSYRLSVNNNDTVEFRDNYVENTDDNAKGGAIICDYVSGYVGLSHNTDVKFVGNYINSKYDAYGGAIYGRNGSNIEITNNDNVSFDGNLANSLESRGGAICGSTVAINDNGNVYIGNNSACSGGAIYATYKLNIIDNDCVIFENNAEKNEKSYRMRGLVIEDNGTLVNVTLSAAEGNRIEFRDSVYICDSTSLKINAERGQDKQNGDIIFTGAYTADNLKSWLGRKASNKELQNSYTSEILTTTNLYGGRLRVEDGAIYKGHGITAHNRSEAVVRVRDAELNNIDIDSEQNEIAYNLVFNYGTSLEVAGKSTIRGLIDMKEGSTFKLEEAAHLSFYETLGTEVGTITVNGTAYLEGASTLNANLTLSDGATLEINRLNAGAITLNGALTFGSELYMGDVFLEVLDRLKAANSCVMLFSGLKSIALPQVATDEPNSRIWVESVFLNVMQEKQFYFHYEAETGSLSIVNANYMIPEPATATLSLLALAGLAVRRRR